MMVDDDGFVAHDGDHDADDADDGDNDDDDVVDDDGEDDDDDDAVADMMMTGMTMLFLWLLLSLLTDEEDGARPKQRLCLGFYGFGLKFDFAIMLELGL